MMRRLLVVLVLVAAVFAVYHYLKPVESPESRELKALAERFDDARSELTAAGRAAGMTGTDTTADAAAALQEVRRIEADLEKLRPRLSEKDIPEADRLATALREFRDELR